MKWFAALYVHTNVGVMCSVQDQMNIRVLIEWINHCKVYTIIS